MGSDELLRALPRLNRAVSTLIFFHAHPDDEAIATGGTMRLAADAGHRVVLVVATRGEQGEPVPGVLAEGELLGDRREAETRRAGEILGASRVSFLGYEDSGMADTDTNHNPRCFWQADVEEAATRLADLLADEAPDAITIYDPDGVYGHPDHIQVYRVGTRAAELMGVENVYWSTMNRDRVKEMMASPEFAAEMEVEEQQITEDDAFGMPADELTHAIDVTGVLDVKRAAMAAHASQIGADTFFLTLPDEGFAAAFGTEWYAAAGHTRSGDFATKLFERQD